MNMTLDGLEELIRQTYPRNKPNWKKNAQVNIVRYADDFIITGKNQEILEHKVTPLVKNFLAKRGLELSEEKTRIRRITEGVDFLGFTIRKYPCGKVLTKPSLKSQKRFRQEIKIELSKKRTATQAEVIAKIHPKITGWMQYYKHCAAKETFGKIDHWLWQRLWRWAKRRHPNKSLKWVKTKYFHRYEGQDWYFGIWEKKNNKSIFRHLPKMSNIPIKRHALIKGEYNPYDPKWKEYSKKRSETLMRGNMTNMIYRLWKQQEGICQICQQEIEQITKWHIHHKLSRKKGGTETLSNLILLHPECHRQLHSRDTAGLPVQGNLIYA